MESTGKKGDSDRFGDLEAKERERHRRTFTKFRRIFSGSDVDIRAVGAELDREHQHPNGAKTKEWLVTAHGPGKNSHRKFSSKKKKERKAG